MARRGVTARLQHPIIDFHSHVRGEEHLKNISPGGLLYSATGLVAAITEPWLYKVVKQVAYHVRHPVGIRLMDRISGLVFHEIQRLFNKHHLQELLASMEENAIEQAVILTIEPYLSVEPVLAVLEPYKERFPVFASLKPGDPQGLETLRQGIEDGRFAGLKIHPVQEFPPTGEAVFSLCELADSWGLPVVFHTGTFPFRRPEHRHRDYDENVGSLEPVIAAFPKVPIVLAHTGWDQWRTVLQLGRKYPNVYAETSWQPGHIIRTTVDALGPGRVLFGSDYPLFKQADALHTTYYALSKKEFRIVAYENAIRLLEPAARREATAQKAG